MASATATFTIPIYNLSFLSLFFLVVEYTRWFRSLYFTFCFTSDFVPPVLTYDLILRQVNTAYELLYKMARTKQRAPLQKTPSSDLMERLTDLPESKSQVQNGHSTPSKTSANGSANGSATPKPEASEPEENSPGLLQLAICIGGIYASLYASCSSRCDFLILFGSLADLSHVAFYGVFCRKPSQPLHIRSTAPKEKRSQLSGSRSRSFSIPSSHVLRR